MTCKNCDRVEMTVVSTDDWAALYQNGRKVDEGHSLPALTLARHAGGKPFTLSLRDLYGTAFERKIEFDGLAFPELLSDVPDAD